MNPIDISRANFEELKSQLVDLRAEAHRAWLAHGPSTTREIARLSGMDLLTLRPRSTELYQLGLLELTGRAGREGIYRARTLAEWEAHHIGCRLPANTQLSLTKL